MATLSILERRTFSLDNERQLIQRGLLTNSSSSMRSLHTEAICHSSPQWTDMSELLNSAESLMICGYRRDYAETIYQRYLHYNSDKSNDAMNGLDSFAKRVLMDQSDTVDAGDRSNRKQWKSALHGLGIRQEIIEKMMKDDHSEFRRCNTAVDIITGLIEQTFLTLQNLNNKATRYLGSTTAAEIIFRIADQRVLDHEREWPALPKTCGTRRP